MNRKQPDFSSKIRLTSISFYDLNQFKSSSKGWRRERYIICFRSQYRMVVNGFIQYLFTNWTFYLTNKLFRAAGFIYFPTSTQIVEISEKINVSFLFLPLFSCPSPPLTVSLILNRGIWYLTVKFHM